MTDKKMNKSMRQFYRRVLPDKCIAFSSEEGKVIFSESLNSGYANIFFPLSEQFHTQSEPAYCGLSTLVMVLNALAVDPNRVWKGPWRWYHEEMLDCCLSLDIVQQKGITLEQFTCLAACNNLDLNVIRTQGGEQIESFRQAVKSICSGDGTKVLTCTYSRKVLGQTGDGHFSPIGAYHAGRDMLLIMDVARFKYPPHWIKLELMWEAMQQLDKTTNLPRGYIMMKKTEEFPLSLFRLSTTFRVTIATHNLLQSNMAAFLNSWTSFLRDSKDCGGSSCVDLERFLTLILNALNETLACLLDDESVFTTQFNTCCLDALPKEHVERVTILLKAIEQTNIYKVTNEWVLNFQRNNYPEVIKAPASTESTSCETGTSNCGKKSSKACSKSNCCRINRIGKSVTSESVDVEDLKFDRRSKCASSICSPSKKQKCNAIKHSTTSSTSLMPNENLVTGSHYVTMLLLCWPYQPLEDGPTYLKCLAKYIEESLKVCDPILLNEINLLRQQILSLLRMVESFRI